MHWSDIPQFTAGAPYSVDVSLDAIEATLQRWGDSDAGLQLEPDFQRGHVWTDSQRSAYVEHLLRGGVGSREIRFNCPGWMADFRGPMVLVDGLQRLTAVRMFMDDRLAAFGHLCSQIGGPPPFQKQNLRFSVNSLPDRAAVLKWYVELNDGGVVHAPEELDRVRALLEIEAGGRKASASQAAELPDPIRVARGFYDAVKVVEQRSESLAQRARKVARGEAVAAGPDPERGCSR